MNLAALHFEWTVSLGTMLHLFGMVLLIMGLHYHWRKEVSRTKEIIKRIDERTAALFTQLNETTKV